MPPAMKLRQPTTPSSENRNWGSARKGRMYLDAHLGMSSGRRRLRRRQCIGRLACCAPRRLLARRSSTSCLSTYLNRNRTLSINPVNQNNVSEERKRQAQAINLFRRCAEDVRRECDSGLVNIKQRRSSVSRAPSLSHVLPGPRIPRSRGAIPSASAAGQEPLHTLSCVALFYYFRALRLAPEAFYM